MQEPREVLARRWPQRRTLWIVVTIVSAFVLSGCQGCENLVDNHALVTSDSSPVVGQPVTFKSTWALLRSAHLEDSTGFDLDGDGMFETKADLTKQTQEVTKSYANPASIRISHLVEASDYEPGGGNKNIVANDDADVVGVDLIIRSPSGGNQPPLASFTADPDPANVNEEVIFDATASHDPDGTIADYEWDLDGNGTFETDTGASPVTSQMYANEGIVTVGLRVTDDGGATGQTTRPVVIQTPPPAPVAAVRSASKGKRVSITLSGDSRPLDPGRFLLNGNSLINLDASLQGHSSTVKFPKQLRKRKRMGRWAAKFDVTKDLATDISEFKGIAVVAFPAGGRACLSYEATVPKGGLGGSGAFRVIAGTGKAKRLRGGASGTATGLVAPNSVRLSGRGSLDLHGKASRKFDQFGCAELVSLLPTP